MKRTLKKTIVNTAHGFMRGILACSVVIAPMYSHAAYAAISNTATVSGFLPDGTPITSPPSTFTIATETPTSSITVAKTAVLSDSDAIEGLSSGDRIDYQITLVNDGAVSVTGVTPVDQLSQNGTALQLDAPLALVSGDDVAPGILNPGETWIYTASYTIEQSNIDNATDVVNSITINGNTVAGPVTATDNAIISLDSNASLLVAKAPITSSYARAGDIVEWAITVTNTGGQTLSPINVTDNTADTVVCSISGDATIATLAPSGIENCTASYEVVSADLANPTLENQVSVQGQIGSTTIGASATASVPRQGADLVTVKSIVSANPAPAIGETVTYDITVTNNGDADATQITLNDVLPAGLTATPNNGTVTQGAYDVATGVWTIASLTDGQSATLTLEGIVAAGQGGAVISNTVSAAVSAEFDPTDSGDVLTAIFTAVKLPILAADDTLTSPVDGANAIPAVLNVFDGDTLGTAALDGTLATVTQVGVWPVGFTLNGDGTIDMAAGVPSGVYTFEYQICEIADPTNCDTATITIPVESSLPLLSGTVYLDRNQNGAFDSSDSPLPNYIVQLVKDGVILEETTTGANGGYQFTGFAPDTYDIVFLAPGTRRGVGIIQNVVVGEGATVIDQDQPIDPSGVVYNSLTGQPVSGATLTLVDGSGTPLPAVCLLAGQQNQVTTADGEYRFDIVAGASPSCPIGRTEYAIEITVPAGYLPIPSGNIPPQPGLLDPSVCALDVTLGGACNLHIDNTPAPVSAPSVYYLNFLIGLGDPDVVYNHIPLDPIPSASTSGLTIDKTAAQSVVRLGDTISYTITLNNSLANPYNGLTVVDTLASGTVYTPGSARVNGTAVDPVVNGRILEFNGLSIAANGRLEVTLSARVGQQTSASELTNVAQGLSADGTPITDVARATVRLEAEPVFACSTIIGKVFDDKNRNGVQDAQTSPFTPEPGLPGVRLATVDGLLITTDQYGRYSVPCAALPDADTGSNFILKLDTRTLPTGYRVTTENPRVVLVTAGKMTSINFGAAVSRVVRIDLSGSAFKSGTAEPNTRLDAGINTLVQALETEPSVLSLTYIDNGEGNALARQRLAEVEKLVRQRLRRAQLGIDLWIETKIIKP